MTDRPTIPGLTCPATTWWCPDDFEQTAVRLHCTLPIGHTQPHADDDGDWTDD